jgi:dGTPase
MNVRSSNPDACAVRDDQTGGRRHSEPSPGDSPFELDRRRLLHCTAFRRLVHKTQVFVSHEGDHFRTRLTHTLEVAAHAERIAHRLGLNATLAGAVALAHDLGHPPFGHAGEKALGEVMVGHGGFEHNVQSLRVVDYLEHPYPAFRGLNLSFEVREGLIKHTTLYDRPVASDDPACAELFAAGPRPPLEGQVVNVADLLTYTLHDIEDGLMQFMIDEPALMGSRLWRDASEPVRRSWPDLDISAVRRPILDAMAELMIEDCVEESRRRIAEAGVKSTDEVRCCGRDLIALSAEMSREVAVLQGLLKEYVYRNYRVVRMDAKARRMIRDLFAAYVAEPYLMPPRYVRRVKEQGIERVVCDYVAGMTDRFCRRECARLFSPESFDG